jgi:hypothetical protein
MTLLDMKEVHTNITKQGKVGKEGSDNKYLKKE